MYEIATILHTKNVQIIMDLNNSKQVEHVLQYKFS